MWGEAAICAKCRLLLASAAAAAAAPASTIKQGARPTPARRPAGCTSGKTTTRAACYLLSVLTFVMALESFVPQTVASPVRKQQKTSERYLDPYSPCGGWRRHERRRRRSVAPEGSGDLTAYLADSDDEEEELMPPDLQDADDDDVASGSGDGVSAAWRREAVAAVQHAARLRHRTAHVMDRYAAARFRGSRRRRHGGAAATWRRDLEAYTFRGLPAVLEPAAASEGAAAREQPAAWRGTVEVAYHDLVRIIYFLREAELNERLHEHASFLTDLVRIESEMLSLLCRFRIMDSLLPGGGRGWGGRRVTARVVPDAVRALATKAHRRQRDYVVLNHLHRLLLRTERDLRTLLH